MKKILIANRGEIAVRIIRACREMGIATVAVYSDCDRTALHVRFADEACADRPQRRRARATCASIASSMPRARRAPTPSIPAMAFWPRTKTSRAAVRDAGLTFIGPTPEAIALMGSKTAARRRRCAAGVPVVPGTETPLGVRRA